MDKLIKFVLDFGVGIIKLLFVAFVLITLWGWFFAERTGITLTYHDAVGMTYVISLFTIDIFMRVGKETHEASPARVNGALIVVFYPLILLFGYIWHLILR